MNTLPKITIIIPVYNGEQALKQCLSSIPHQTYKNYEVIIVDNNSNDATKKIIIDFQKEHNKFKYLFEKQKSVGKARNAGINMATGDILVFTDSDCTVPNNWIEKLTKPILHENENVAMGSSKDNISNYWTKNIQKAALNFLKENTSGKYINSLDGKNFAIKTSLMKTLMFDPEIKMTDDLDLYIRLKKLTKVRFLENIKVGHYHQCSFVKIVKMNFKRGFWSVKIHAKYTSDDIKDIPQINNISIKNYFTFPFWMAYKFITKSISESYFIFISELSWRIGVVWAKLT